MTDQREQLISFQWEVLDVIKKFVGDGAAPNDVIALLLNVASIMAITTDLSLDKTVKMLEKVYGVAHAESLPKLN